VVYVEAVNGPEHARIIQRPVAETETARGVGEFANTAYSSGGDGLPPARKILVHASLHPSDGIHVTSYFGMQGEE
jgi:hypothetical protein